MPRGKKGTVYTRKGSPHYHARVTIQGRNRYKSGFETKAMARIWIDGQLREAMRAEVLGIEPIREDMTLKAFLPRWLKSIRPRVADSTYESYENIALQILLPRFKEKPLAKIKRRDVEDLIALRAAAGRSAATINRNLSVLSRLMEFAKDMGFARQNPVKGVRRAREVPRSYPYLSPEDEARLLAAMPGWLRTPSLIALDAGLRAGEIEALIPRDVDLRRAVIRVRHSKNRMPREVGMTSRLKRALTRHVKQMGRGAQRVFKLPDGRSFNRSTYRPAFLQATKASELDGLRFHDLRHSCGVRLAEAGATPAVIKAVLGHKCLAATMRYMDHAPLDAARTAALLLDAHRDPRSGSAGAKAAVE